MGKGAGVVHVNPGIGFLNAAGPAVHYEWQADLVQQRNPFVHHQRRLQDHGIDRVARLVFAIDPAFVAVGHPGQHHVIAVFGKGS